MTPSYQVKFLCLTLAILPIGSTHAQDAQHQETQQQEEHHEAEDHHNHSEGSSEQSNTAVNVVEVGEYHISLEPLVAEDEFRLGIGGGGAAQLDLYVQSPGGMTVPLLFYKAGEDEPVEAADGDHDDSDNDDAGHDHAEHADTSRISAAMPGLEAGRWRLFGTVAGEHIDSRFDLYRVETQGYQAYLILTPAPTLSNRGSSEAFLYLFENGESVHAAVRLSRHMPTMQHFSDTETLFLMHDHFNQAYDDGSFVPMANRIPLTFAMTGMWELDISLEHGDESASFKFEVEVADE